MKGYSIGLQLLFFCFIFLVISCSKKSNGIVENPPVMSGKSYLALGDSYTIGEGVQINERFPHLTVAKLRQQNINIQNPVYIAKTGWTTANLLTAIQNQRPLGPFDVVSLLIGVNDQYQGLDTSGYRTRFTQLLNIALELAGNRRSNVFVLSIPDYSATPFVSEANKQRVRTEINNFNSINKEVTLLNNVSYINISEFSRQAANDLSLLASDRLHYSGKEHQIWADELAVSMSKVLK